MSEAPAPLADLIAGLDRLIAEAPLEAEVLSQGRRLLGALVSRDDWLPAAYTEPGTDRYRQYLLYRDPTARFSVVSFVWGPGQFTPVHDHTVWGLVGVLRGAELSQRFAIPADGPPAPVGPTERLEPGDVSAVSPTAGDVHRVSNAYGDRASISIHVYGADIGAVTRSVFPAEGGRRQFVSGYDNSAATPPFRLRSKERAA